MKHNVPVPTLVVFGMCTVTAACGDLFGPGSNPSFHALPDTVVAGDTVQVVFTLRNGMPYPVTIRSAYGCLFFLQTFQGDQRVPWRGTDYDCQTAVTDFIIPPRDSLHVVHQLVAAQVGTAPGAVLPAGTYHIRTVMNTALPDLEAEVSVRPSLP